MHDPYADTSLEQLTNTRTRILETKLEMFTLELHERLRVRTLNFQSLDQDTSLINTMLFALIQQHPYDLNSRGKSALESKLFDIEKERRSERTESWKDIIQVMKDFLTTWEAHEQAKIRAEVLSYAG